MFYLPLARGCSGSTMSFCSYSCSTCACVPPGGVRMYTYLYIYIYNQVSGTGAFACPVDPGAWTMGGRRPCFWDSGRTFEFWPAVVGPGPDGPERSRFWPKVRIFGRTFEIPAGRSKFSRTFEISTGRSKFRSDVRNSGRTFKIPAERLKYWPNVRNSGRTFEIRNSGINENCDKGSKIGLPEFVVEANLMF